MELQQIATNATRRSLSTAKMAAVEALLAGETISAAAEAARVDRVTVYRWLKADSAFQEELKRGREEMRLATFGHLQRLAVKAAACVEKALDHDDVKTAMEILKRLKVFAPGPVGLDEPSELASEAEIEAAQRQDDPEQAYSPAIKDRFRAEELQTA